MDLVVCPKQKVVVLGSQDEIYGASHLFLSSDISVCFSWMDIVGKGRRLIVGFKLHA